MSRPLMRVTVLDANPGHVRVRVAIGPDADHLATAGFLTFRAEEWPAMRASLAVIAEVRDDLGEAQPCPYALEKTHYRTCPRDVHGLDGPRCEGCPAASEEAVA